MNPMNPVNPQSKTETPPAGPAGPDREEQVTVSIVTQGCKLNQSDSQGLARQFAAAGYRMVDPDSQPRVVVVNTCTVTGAADSKARQALRAAKRANPQALVVAAGCYAEGSPDVLNKLEAVSLVVGNSRKWELVSLVTSALGDETPAPASGSPPGLAPLPVADGNGASFPDTLALAPLPTLFPPTRRTRAMIKIQEGCDQVCAYCIVPKVRGRERSIPPADLIAQIKECQDRGVQEVVLTGTQLGSYGFDLPDANLRSLLAGILAETIAPRVRVSSVQPQEFSPELLELWQDDRLCPHFHIPLQSGSDPVLKAMRRRYTTAGFAAAVDLVRRTVPDASVTTDVIVGFPGESAEMFQQSLDFAASMEFSAIHAFQFSARPGTSAFYLRDQTPPPEKKSRMDRMLAVAEESSRRFRRRQLGRSYPVLWESLDASEANDGGAGVWRGLTPNYLRVYGSSNRDLENVITEAMLVEESGNRVVARILQN